MPINYYQENYVHEIFEAHLKFLAIIKGPLPWCGKSEGILLNEIIYEINLAAERK